LRENNDLLEVDAKQRLGGKSTSQHLDHSASARALRHHTYIKEQLYMVSPQNTSSVQASIAEHSTILQALGDRKPPPRQLVRQNSYLALSSSGKNSVNNSWIWIAIRISTKTTGFCK